MRIVRVSGGRRGIAMLGASLLSFISLVGFAAPADAVLERTFAGVCPLGVTTDFPVTSAPSLTSVGTSGMTAVFSGSCVYAPPGTPGSFFASVPLQPTGLAGPCGTGVYTGSATVFTAGTAFSNVRFEVVLLGAEATVVAQTDNAMFLMTGEMLTAEPCKAHSVWTGVFVVEDPTLPV